MKKIFFYLFILMLAPNFSMAKITYMEILSDPTNLKLNLVYAKEKELSGEYKATIATLERLSMLYPANTDIKIYLLSILLKIDSNAKLELMIETMLQDPNTSQESRDYITELLESIKEQTKSRDKWFAYADFNYTHTENSNIEGVSKTGKLFQKNSPQDFVDETIKYDKTYTRGGSLTWGKNINSTSAISFNTGVSIITQNKGKLAANDLTSGSISYTKLLGKHYFLPFVYYSRPNHRDAVDLSTRGIGFSNSYNINKNNSIAYGSSISDTRYNRVSGFEGDHEDKKNSQTYSANVGYNYTFFDKNLISSKISYTRKKATKNSFAYKSPGFNIGYTRLFPFGTFKIDRTYKRNIHDEMNLFISSANDRIDDIVTSKIQLGGRISQLLPFVKKIDPKNQLFYSIKDTKIDSDSTLLNNTSITQTTSFNIIKRFNLHE